MPVHAVAEGGTFSFMAPELLIPAKFGFESSVPTREADVFAFGLVVLQVFHVNCPECLHRSANLCRFSRGNHRLITLRSMNAHTQSLRVYDQENPRTLRPSGFRLLYGSSWRHVGVKIWYDGRQFGLLWILFAMRLRDGTPLCHHPVRQILKMHLPQGRMRGLSTVTVCYSSRLPLSGCSYLISCHGWTGATPFHPFHKAAAPEPVADR